MELGRILELEPALASDDQVPIGWSNVYGARPEAIAVAGKFRIDPTAPSQDLRELRRYERRQVLNDGDRGGKGHRKLGQQRLERRDASGGRGDDDQIERSAGKEYGAPARRRAPAIITEGNFHFVCRNRPDPGSLGKHTRSYGAAQCFVR